MDKVKKIASVCFTVFLVLLTISYILLMELSRNIVLGWIIGIVLVAVFGFIRFTFKKNEIWDSKKAGICFLALCLLLFINYLITGPREKCVPAVDYKNPIVTAPVHVAQGDLTGVFNNEHDVKIYAGIPYAKPPIDDLRWKEPQAPSKWSGVRACDTFAPKAMQKNPSELYASLSNLLGTHEYIFSLDDQYKEAMSEDCLYLNIFAPAEYSGEPLPVVFYIHGGSLKTGSSFSIKHRGESFAKKGVIFVSIGYRLGVFGYMANNELVAESPNNTTGNYGLLDQIAALKWVHENIYAFGGNPDNITIAGESAGSSSVNALCVSPLTEGLFVRAIAESSGICVKKPYHTFRDMSKALEEGEVLMQEFKAKNIEDLRKIKAAKLINTSAVNEGMCVDGYAITEQPYLTYEKGKNHEQALLNGSNLKEADAFMFNTVATTENYEEVLEPVLGRYASEAAELVPAESIVRDQTFFVDKGKEAKGSAAYVYSDAWFSYSHHVWSRYMEAEGRPVYQYFFTKTNNHLSNHHAGELVYAYGSLWRYPGLYDKSDEALSETMQIYWTNFAKTGDPNEGGIPYWPQWNSKDDKLFELGNQIRLIDNPYQELNEIIDKYQNE